MAIGASAAFVAAVSGAVAQETRVLRDTVVSASRNPVDARTVGSAVTVIRQEDIDARKKTFAADLLRDVPGVHVNRTGVFGQFTQIRVRGAEGNHLKVRIDGMDINDPGAGNEFQFESLLGYGLSRVEVLRGPQSGLYGADALAGVVSFYTPDPKPGAHLETISEFGSFGSILFGGRASGGNEKIRLSLFGVKQRMNGANTVRRSNTLFADEDDANANTTIHGKFKAFVTDWLELSLVGRFNRTFIEFDADTNFDGLVDDADRVTRRTNFNILGQAKLSFLNDRWRSVFSFQYMDSDIDNFSNGAQGTSQAAQRYKLGAQTSLDFKTGGFADAKHRITLALEYERQQFEQTGAVTNFFGTIFNPNQQRERDKIGLVGEYRLSLLDKMFFNVALRYDGQNAFEDQFSWRVSGAYLIKSTGTRFHASVARGFKNPTFTEQFGFFPNRFVGNPNLKPETSIGWDIGIEQRLFRDKAIIDVTFFQANLENEINGFASAGGGLSTAQNFAGTSTRHGIEFSVTARPIKGLKIVGSYTYLISQQPPRTAELRRPQHSGAINVAYRFYRKKALINVGLTFNGPQKDTEFGNFTRVNLGGYVLANITGSFKVTPNVELYGRVENAFNQRYEEVFSYKAPRIGVFGGIKIKY